MKAFLNLFQSVDASTKTLHKVSALRQFFTEAEDAEKLAVLALFTGRRPKRAVSAGLLKAWASEYAQVPLWLMDECHSIAGDLSETLELLLPPAEEPVDMPLMHWLEYVKGLSGLPEVEKKTKTLYAWNRLPAGERFLFSKLSSSSFRVGASEQLVIRALAEATSIDPNEIKMRIMGSWDAFNTSFQELLLAPMGAESQNKPYPFCLAHPLDQEPEALGDISEWQAEWKWDGIRGQIIKRGGQVHIWSRGEDLLTEKFPELVEAAAALPDGVVLDGEILPYADGQILPFHILQTRIGRKNLTPKALKDAPIVFYAYDLLELEGQDLREEALSTRTTALEQVVQILASSTISRPPKVNYSSWDELATQRLLARQEMAEGLMLKRKDGPYIAGRKKGNWWKWKIEPMTLDAVLIYAQRGTGRRANLLTDYTFALWNEDRLVTVAKAYSGLTDSEINELDQWAKKHTIERFGPVHTVQPFHVFEIGFEGIQESKRHKAGIALRFPRILRWRKDKPAAEADTLENAHDLLKLYASQS